MAENEEGTGFAVTEVTPIIKKLEEHAVALEAAGDDSIEHEEKVLSVRLIGEAIKNGWEHLSDDLRAKFKEIADVL